MNQFDYVIFSSKDAAEDDYLCDWLSNEQEIEEDGFMEENDYDSFEGVVINPNHYLKAFFFYNDMSDYADVDEYAAINFKCIEHIDLYYESNNGGGHLQLVKTEEWKDGVLFDTVINSNPDGFYND